MRANLSRPAPWAKSSISAAFTRLHAPQQPRSITVFVRRVNGIFIANTYLADAIDPRSASIAARKCGARSLGAEESEIEVIPESDHTMIARVREPEPAIARVWLTWAAIFLAVLAAVFVWLVKGGAS